jgi:hypothetical protein
MTPHQRLLAFLIGCIGTRLWFVHLAKTVSPEHLKIMGWMALIIATGFIYLFLINGRQTGAEAGGKIWWTELRPLHGCLYLLFALLAIKGRTQTAWKVLLLDVTIGLIAWLKNKNII